MNFNPQQQHILLSKMGYTGPADPKMMEAFLSSNPGAAAKMGKFNRVIQKTSAAGLAEGGFVINPISVTEQTRGKGEDRKVTRYQVVDAQGNVKGTFNSQAEASAALSSLSTPTPTTTPTPAPSTPTTPTTPAPSTPTTPTTPKSPGTQLAETLIQTPADLATQAPVAQVTETPGTVIGEGAGQVSSSVVAPTVQTGAVQTTAVPTPTAPATMTAETAAGGVAQVAAGTEAVQGAITPGSLVTAAQQTESSISGMEAAQGAAFLMDNPVQRGLQAGELVSGSAVDAAKVQSMMDDIRAATATPSKQATVQGQLEGLMQQFEGGQTPAWAAGAMRAAQGMLAQRGLGASSIAGQAIIQAAMESALPIAQADAATRAQFEVQNLSNRQQTALFAAQQRAAFLQQEFDQSFQTRVLNAAKVSDIANMNFTAEQNIALENSRAVNTMNLANLDARQGMILAQAAALSNLDIANLSNRQQAAVQNAQAFLQMDMANLDREQQVELFRAQSNIQALFTDQAAENAARQFNAASKNQTDQFFADLTSRVAMFNSEQKNAMAQFNAGETNATSRFNAQLEAQRQQFNAQNSLIVAQANAVWRQNIATTNTAAQNESNMEMARTMNALTAKALDEIWQKERDTMAYAFTAMESEKDRAADLLLADKRDDLIRWQTDEAEDSAKWAAVTKLVFGDWL